MATQYHIAQSGKMKGSLVPCYAKNCRNNVDLNNSRSPYDYFVLHPETVKDVEHMNAISRENLANRTEDAAILVMLSSDVDENVRYAVAFNRNIPEKAQLILAADEDADVQYRLAENPALTNKAAVKLASTDNKYYGHIHQRLLDNRSTSAEVLETILAQNDWKQAARVVVHKNATPELIALACEKEIADVIEFSDVRYFAVKNIKTNTATLSRVIETCQDFNVLSIVAKHKNLSQTDVKLLANHQEYRIRTAVAARKDLPEDVLLGLLIDSDVSVRTAAYYNPKTGEDYRPAAILAGGINRRSETIY